MSYFASITLTEVSPVTASVVVAAGPTATVLAAPGTFVTGCIVVAKTTNVDNILLGDGTTQIINITPGNVFSLVCGLGRKTDLNKYKIFGTAGEGVDILYTTP